jgi:hypothetical protein
MGAFPAFIVRLLLAFPRSGVYTFAKAKPSMRTIRRLTPESR